MNAQQDSFGNYTPIQTPQAPPIAGSVAIIIVGTGNPTGIVTGLPNTFFFDSVGLTYYFTPDGTTWEAVSGGGGGSTQVFAGNYSGGQPNFTPTTSVAIALDTSNGTQWSFYSGAWH